MKCGRNQLGMSLTLLKQLNSAPINFVEIAGRPYYFSRIVRDELQRFFNTSEFVRTDSLMQQDWLKWSDLKPQSPEALEISRKNLMMFNYYSGAGGSRGIVWSPVRKKIIRVWKSS